MKQTQAPTAPGVPRTHGGCHAAQIRKAAAVSVPTRYDRDGYADGDRLDFLATLCLWGKTGGSGEMVYALGLGPSA